MIRKLSLLIFFAFLLSPCVRADARTSQPFKAKVVGITDGDTIDVLFEKTQIRIRLYGIDCPEKSQAFGTKAKEETSNIIFGHIVTVSPLKQETYNRIVARIASEDGTDLSTELVRNGMCWWYQKYAPKDKILAVLQEAAQMSHTGIFRDPHAVPPWQYRRPPHKAPPDCGRGEYCRKREK